MLRRVQLAKYGDDAVASIELDVHWVGRAAASHNDLRHTDRSYTPGSVQFTSCRGSSLADVEIWMEEVDRQFYQTSVIKRTGYIPSVHTSDSYGVQPFGVIADQNAFAHLPYFVREDQERYAQYLENWLASRYLLPTLDDVTPCLAFIGSEAILLQLDDFAFGFSGLTKALESPKTLALPREIFDTWLQDGSLPYGRYGCNLAYASNYGNLSQFVGGETTCMTRPPCISMNRHVSIMSEVDPMPADRARDVVAEWVLKTVQQQRRTQGRGFLLLDLGTWATAAPSEAIKTKLPDYVFTPGVELSAYKAWFNVSTLQLSLDPAQPRAQQQLLLQQRHLFYGTGVPPFNHSITKAVLTLGFSVKRANKKQDKAIQRYYQEWRSAPREAQMYWRPILACNPQDIPAAQLHAATERVIFTEVGQVHMEDDNRVSLDGWPAAVNPEFTDGWRNSDGQYRPTAGVRLQIHANILEEDPWTTTQSELDLLPAMSGKALYAALCKQVEMHCIAKRHSGDIVHIYVVFPAAVAS